MGYSPAYKVKMIKKMTGPYARSANALAAEVGVSQGTLSRWLREAANVPRVSGSKQHNPERSGGKRAQDWTAAEKLKLVMEAAGISEDELGAFLRRKGLHREQLEQWKMQVEAGATSALDERPEKKGRRSPEQRRIRELERQLRRKDKALAETAALLVLKKNWKPSSGTRTTT